MPVSLLRPARSFTLEAKRKLRAGWIVRNCAASSKPSCPARTAPSDAFSSGGTSFARSGARLKKYASIRAHERLQDQPASTST